MATGQRLYWRCSGATTPYNLKSLHSLPALKNRRRLKPRPLPTNANDIRYDYVNEHGDIVFVVIRHNRADGKRFSQWTPSDNQWLPIGPTGTRPLYLLPSIGASGKVAVVEGELCVHAALAAWPSQVVTCWAGGTGAWQLSDWTPFSRA